jgi:Fic family protein
LLLYHPYYDGDGRTARLILHLGGYDLKGLYSLEEYYARNLGAYYEAISIGDSHNYYMGRTETDITNWVEYFVEKEWHFHLKMF